MFDAIVFENMLRKLIGLERNLAEATIRRRCRSHIGVSFEVCSDVWKRLTLERLLPLKAQPNHLLWALLRLNMYESIDCLSTKLKVDPSTCRKWIWLMIRAIESLETSVVSSMTYLPEAWNYHNEMIGSDLGRPEMVWCLQLLLH